MIQNTNKDSVVQNNYSMFDFILCPLTKLWSKIKSISNIIFHGCYSNNYNNNNLTSDVYNRINVKHETLSDIPANVVTSNLPRPTQPSVQPTPSIAPVPQSIAPVQQLRQMMRQMVGGALECIDSDNPLLKIVLKKIAARVPNLSDAMTEVVCKVIQSIPFEKIVDQSITLLHAEVKSHAAAQKSLQHEAEKIQNAKKDIEAKEKAIISFVTDNTYSEAKKYLNTVLTTGEKQIYNAAYEKALASNKDHKEAEEIAQECIHALKSNPKGDEMRIDAYLNEIYMGKFAEHGLTPRAEKIYSQGSSDVVKEMDGLVNDMLDQTPAWIEKLFDDSMLSNELKPLVKEMLVDLIKYILIENVINPSKMDQHIANSALPGLKEGLIGQTCKMLISEHSSQFAPHLAKMENSSSDESKVVVVKEIITLVTKIAKEKQFFTLGVSQAEIEKGVEAAIVAILDKQPPVEYHIGSAKANAFTSQLIADTIFSLSLECSGIAPKLEVVAKVLAGPLSLIKNKINEVADRVMTPYRGSNEKILEDTVKALSKKLCKEDGITVDKQKLKNILFSKNAKENSKKVIENPSKRDVEHELKIAAKLIFDLTKLTPHHGLIKTVLLGNDERDLEKALNTLRRGFLGHELINFSRTEKISKIIVDALKETKAGIQHQNHHVS